MKHTHCTVCGSDYATSEQIDENAEVTRGRNYLRQQLAASQECNSELLGALRGLMSLTAAAYGNQVNEVPEYQKAKAALVPSSMSVPKTAQEREAKLREAVDAVRDLINDSEGVAGLHMNGDIAPWDELLEGGRYEEWLAPLSEALRLIEAQPAQEAGDE